MVKIDYWCELFDNQLPHLYTLFQADVSEVFYICVGNQLVGTINKVTDGWQQIGGDRMPTKFIEELGRVIESNLVPDYGAS